jgi:hypothetical protein
MATVFKRGGPRAKGYWYAAWHDHNGQRKTKCTRTTDKATAGRIAHKYEADAALRREGVIDPSLDGIGKESQRTIESHLADYESKLRAGGRSEQYVRETLKYVRDIVSTGGWRIAADIKADAVSRHATGLQKKNKSARTVQANITAIKGFTK